MWFESKSVTLNFGFVVHWTLGLWSKNTVEARLFFFYFLVFLFNFIAIPIKNRTRNTNTTSLGKIRKGWDFVISELNKTAKKKCVASSRQHTTEAKEYHNNTVSTYSFFRSELRLKKQKDLRLFREATKRFSSPQQPWWCR